MGRSRDRRVASEWESDRVRLLYRKCVWVCAGKCTFVGPSLDSSWSPGTHSLIVRGWFFVYLRLCIPKVLFQYFCSDYDNNRGDFRFTFLFFVSSFRPRAAKKRTLSKLLECVCFFFVSKMFKKSIDFQNSHTRTPKKPVLRCVLSKSNTTVVLLRNQFVTAGEAGHTGHMRIDGHVEGHFPAHNNIHRHRERESVISTWTDYCEFLGWDTSINYPN